MTSVMVVNLYVKYENNMMIIITFLVAQCACLKQPLRIYGGIDAKPDEYTYVVRIEMQRYFRNNNNSITYDHEHLCTSSALSSEWVLSAAHCFEDLSEFHYGSPYTVEKLVIRHGHVEHLPGVHDSFSDVLFAVMHPLYTSTHTDNTYSRSWKTKHDIALLKTRPMSIRSYAKLSAVDYKSFYGHEAVLAGFGITTKTHADGSIETDNTLALKKPLQVLKVLITKCNSAENVNVGLCLVNRCGRESVACGGDSGGPLLHASGVSGVLSEGPSSGYCLDSDEKGTHNIAAYVIPVTPYIEWIYSVIQN